MKVLYDHQAFTMQQYGGISRYFFRLIKELQTIGGVACDVSLKYSNNDYVPTLDCQNSKRFLPNLDFKGKYRVMNFINSRYTVQKLKEGTFDLFHPTYYNNYFVDVIQDKKPFVLTVHDLIHEKFCSDYPQLDAKGSHTKSKRRLLHKADRIIAISNSTQNDLVNIYNIDPEKIDVVYHASSFEGKAKAIVYEKENYILFVGNRNFYKNFNFFLEVVSSYLLKYNLKLLCAGGGSFSSDEKQLIRKLGITHLVIRKKVQSDQVLMALYQKALLFVFPSLYEGFGIPVLEALQSGCPVIASHTSSLPEVGGDAAIYFNPRDKESLRSALDKVLTDTALRNSMIVRGIEQNKKFSWSKCANETMASYRAVLSSKRN